MSAKCYSVFWPGVFFKLVCIYRDNDSNYSLTYRNRSTSGGCAMEDVR